jgi:DNA-binding transcriptional ArsR family regulator
MRLTIARRADIFTHMDERSDEDGLSAALRAAADPTRRSILTTLVQEGPMRVTDLAARYTVSLNTVSKHIKALEAAGLVKRTTIGRVHLIAAELGPVAAVEAWFRKLRSIWDIRLERLDDLMTKENPDG